MFLDGQDVEGIGGAGNAADGEEGMISSLSIRHRWVQERLAHMVSQFKYQYGVDAVVKIDQLVDRYSLVLQDKEHGLELVISESAVVVMNSDIREEVSGAWMNFVNSLPLSEHYSMANELTKSELTAVGTGTGGVVKWEMRQGLSSEIYDMSAQELLQGLAMEKLSHIGTVVQYRYGFDVEYGFIGGRYYLRMLHDCFSGVREVSYELAGLWVCDVEDEAFVLRSVFLQDYFFGAD
jgi:hypothetical protein